jgi:hypothetical protein
MAPPREGRIDRGQLGALLELTLRQLLRPGVDPSSRVRVQPLRQTVLSIGFFGLLFATNAVRAPDLPTFLALLFFTTLVIVSLTINPETPDVRERSLEVLLVKPVAALTFLAARTVVLLAISGLVATSFGAAPLLAAALRFGLSPLVVAADYAMLLAAAFTAATLWLHLMLAALRWISAERLRRATQTALAVFNLAVAVLSLASFGFAEATSLPDPIRGLGRARAVLEALPSTWFALFWHREWLSAPHRAAVVALVAATVALALRGGLAKYYPHLLEQAALPRPSPGRRSLAVRLLEALTRLPPVGQRLFPPASVGLGAAILTLSQREEVSRLKVLVPRLVALLFFLLGLSGGQELLPLSMLAYFTFAAAVEGLDAVGQSAHAPASWLLHAAPLRGQEAARGVLLAVTLRFLLFPLTLLAVLLFRRHPPLLAGLLAAGTLFAGRAAVAARLALWPALPLSREQRATQSLAGVALGFGLTVTGGAAYAVASFLADRLGIIGLAAVALGVGATAAAGLSMRLLAGHRLRTLECAY